MKPSQTHLPSLLGSIWFALSGLFLLGIALTMGLVALISLLTGNPVDASQTIFFSTFGFESVVLFMAAFIAAQKMLQQPSADRQTTVSIPIWGILAVVLLAGLSILIGSWVGEIETVNWLFLPILSIPAIVLPLAVIFALASHRLRLGSRWQTWSVLGLGMSLVPLLLLALEAITAIVLFVGVVAYVLAQPELANRLQAISEQMLVLGPQSEAAQELLSPIITQPAVIVLALLYMAVLVPVLEEIFKPLGIWLLAGRLDSAAQGFALGALSGAGYALIETIGVSGQPGGWAILLLSRIGTGLLHITTSALVGAAIVRAWREHRYLNLLGTYALAVLLHGLWNACALLFTFSEVAELLDQPNSLITLQPALIVALSFLAMGFLAILLISNRRLRNTNVPQSAEPGQLGVPMDETL